MKEEIVITQELTVRQKIEVGQLFYQVFPLKASHLWPLVRNSKEAGKLFLKAIHWKNGYFALKEDHVVGFVGLNCRQARFTQLKFPSFLKVFGWFGGLWRFAYHKIFSLFFPKVRKEELQVDYIGVAGEAQGLGIGTRLLKCVFKQAKEEGYQQVILDVVDTNPKARKLYESLGFRLINHHYYGIITASAGFRGSATMRKGL